MVSAADADAAVDAPALALADAENVRDAVNSIMKN